MAIGQSALPAASERVRGATTCACSPRDRGDGALGNAILEVGIHATEGELLSRVMAGLLEGVVVEVPVVAVVVEDLHAVLGGECLEGAFGSESFGGCIVDFEVDEAQTAEVVNKNGGAPVAPPGEFAFHLRQESDFS